MVDKDSGIYLLKIKLASKEQIKVGALGINDFVRGYYYYIGSAQKNLKSRLARHLSSNKKFHWHIDYLLDKAKVVDYFTIDGPKNYECKLFNYLNKKDKFQVVLEGFGSSDCSCISHLLFSKEKIALEKILRNFKKDIQ